MGNRVECISGSQIPKATQRSYLFVFSGEEIKKSGGICAIIMPSILKTLKLKRGKPQLIPKNGYGQIKWKDLDHF